MNTQPHSWTPYEITGVDASVDEPRMGFIGRAAAMRINGVEVIVMCRHDHELVAVGGTLAYGFDPKLIYKATLIHSSGIQITVPEQPAAPATVVEETIAEPVVEQPAAPATVVEEPAVVVQPETLVRGDDGVPLVSYKKPTLDDDDEL